MKSSIELHIGQHLTLTPQLQQAIRLLQLSTLDLQAEIQQVIESNPMLEAAPLEEKGEEDFSAKSSIPDEFPEVQWAQLYGNSNKSLMTDDQDFNFENVQGTTTSLQ